MDLINQIDLRNFFQSSYIFETTPDAEGLYKYLSIVFALFVIIAFILIIRAKNKEKIFKNLDAKFINLLLFTGLIGIVLVFFRWQGIPYLGSRVMLLVLAFISLLWIGIIGWYKFRVLPKKIEENIKRKNFEKYLP